MARAAPKSAPNDGMSWLALAPFPAFNPLNWGALVNPRNYWLASLNNAQLALDAWRAGADGLRAMVRLQQDEMLAALDAPLEERAGEAAKADGASEAAETAKDAETSAAASLLVQPMIEVTRAYGRVGRAFIVAQRDTMRAFSQTEKPH